MKGPATLQATFDEYTVVLALNYPGRGISFEGSHSIDLEELMGEDGGMEALDAAMSTISARLIQKLADEVKCDESGDRATLYLEFIH